MERSRMACLDRGRVIAQGAGLPQLALATGRAATADDSSQNKELESVPLPDGPMTENTPVHQTRLNLAGCQGLPRLSQILHH